MDGLKRYVNDDRFRVDGDKNMRLLAFAFTIVFVWTGPNSSEVHVWRVGPESETAKNTTLGNQGTSETSEKKTVASALQLFAVRAS